MKSSSWPEQLSEPMNRTAHDHWNRAELARIREASSLPRPLLVPDWLFGGTMVRRLAVPVDPCGLGVNSYNRMEVVLGNRSVMERRAWFAQLGEEWSGCDNIASYRAELRRIMRRANSNDLDAMMTREEVDALAQMPPRVDVWRGCYRVNRAGLSWATDRAIAARFPAMNRYRRHGVPLLRHGVAIRERVVLKLDREEHEIIAADVFNITEEELPACVASCVTSVS